MARKSARADAGPSLFTAGGAMQPLAARMRPRTLGELVGQEHVLAPGKALRASLERGTVGSMILWGPPGSGKTTLARIVAETTSRAYVPFSAVSEGVPRIRQIAAEAGERLAAGGPGTILFIDEIHRLNKAQQDSLLPIVEEGTVTLVGATTETPSFEINGALLSRCRVFTLKPLSPDDIVLLLRRALADAERGLAAQRLEVDEDALRTMAVEADGDARRALTVLEAAAAHVGEGGRVTVAVAREAMQLRFARHDKSGEEHFNLLSAYHKSLRGSDPDGALYWAARMIEGGEDPMTLFRRAIAMAAEDIGLADPQALQLAVAARDAFHMLGEPEGYLPLAEMTVYLATAPKSNASYRALQAAFAAARETPAAPVPLHIRNAPTALHRELGHHEGYRYAHDSEDAYTPQEYLPEELRGTTFYTPGRFGFEREVAKRLEWWSRLKREAADEPE
ncbi:MAG TPA: replication-associated recombination protein A [Longimicrobiaceae bacterium]|nr:replication-associated recombination protein A [Longimicrobiaceae bacterium]